IQNVEVLKGPASIYFGRGSTGGIINQVSKAPQPEGFYDGHARRGSGPSAPHAQSLDRDRVKVPRQGFAPTLSLGLGTPTQMNFSYFFQHENNIPDYGFPFFNGKPVRVNRGTWYGLTKDDYEKTYTNIGTISLNHQFSDALNLRSAFRYSNVRRDVEPSIPALT